MRVPKNFSEAWKAGGNLTPHLYNLFLADLEAGKISPTTSHEIGELISQRFAGLPFESHGELIGWTLGLNYDWGVRFLN